MATTYTEKAKKLFLEVDAEIISLSDFQKKLKEVAVEMVANEPEVIKDYYLNDIFEAQFNEFKSNPEKNRYLLSINSSGSLLRTFEAPE